MTAAQPTHVRFELLLSSLHLIRLTVDGLHGRLGLQSDFQRVERMAHRHNSNATCARHRIRSERPLHESHSELPSLFFFLLYLLCRR
jgi:hypothetical protein